MALPHNAVVGMQCVIWCDSVLVCFRARLFINAWERVNLMALVCDVVTFPLVSWVRCDA